ncbi:MFS transporter [Helicobacter mustelae]|uniref:Putative efflux protein (Major facilitator superfamily protein) n=1 Tax=Helicobacter mustelae (strain ATCC 43772 / CCUG 25715 / CIP 103759 / LMG 18044 / NCTC 12198 / R85-136P) TaxID=679897 RepID=D3UJ66_HELM1|nr:MFS transporter [Helicobacter mustelae]CBG40541.1 putative efflux protein (Major facilitator superfamily protein) [Helicobacter mustelae 12198]SQH72039.1 major facilitator superfamily efflux protein [Helicobacter mustelae]STP13182.1 major facilitator superfamily efflux protein [Helicobacter mustelae]
MSIETKRTYHELLLFFTESKLFKAALFSISATTVLGATIIAPSLPALEKHFSDIGPSAEILSKLILTIPSLLMVFFSPIAGFLFERFRRLNIIFFALMIWSLAGISGFFLNNIYLVLTSRAILGIAASFLMTGIGVLLADYYSGARREKALMLQNFFMAFGAGIFLTLGGFLASMSWRYPFLVYSLGFVILIFGIFELFEPIKFHHKTHANPTKFTFSKFIPMYLLGMFIMICFYIAPTQMPFFMTDYLHIDQTRVGVSLAVVSVAMAIGSLFYMQLRKLFSLYEIFFLALSFFALGFACISLVHNYLSVLIGFCFLGASLGISLINTNAWLFHIAEEGERSRAYGFLASSVFLGQATSPLITQTFVSHLGIVKMIAIFTLMLFSVSFLFLFMSWRSQDRKF